MFKTVLCCSSLLAASQAFACYTVTSANDQVLYRAIDPPVDMSRPIHETLPLVFPGGHMVFDLGTDCPRALPVPRPGLPVAARRADNAVVRVLAAADHVVPADGEHREIPTAALVADLGPRAGERAARLSQ